MMDTIQAWDRADMNLTEALLHASMWYAGGGDMEAWQDNFYDLRFVPMAINSDKEWDTATHRQWADSWMERWGLLGIKPMAIPSYYGVYDYDAKEAYRRLEEKKSATVKGDPELELLR